MSLSFRDHVLPSDRKAVREIVESTGFFNPEEAAIALELVDEHLAKGVRSGYLFLFCEDEWGAVLGYTCFGPIPGTSASFDLYWIAVRDQCRGQGIGQGLIRKTEKTIGEMGGSRIYAETSSRDLYEPTHAFYRRTGYVREAFLKDFYTPGDGKLIFVKKL